MTIIQASTWLLVYSKNGLSPVFEQILKNKYNVESITIVLKDY